MRRPHRPGIAALLLASALGAPVLAVADDYPQRPMTAIVASPGMSVDAIMRLIGERLSQAWGQPVIVEHRPGASSTIAYNTIARAAPDGYTFGLAVTNLVQTPHLMPSVPYDPHRDLAPVSLLARGANIFVVNADVPAATLPEFIALAKANPGKYAFASYGVGTTAHILGETFSRQAGLDLLHTPYKGSGPMMQDVMGGQVPAAFPDAASALAQLSSGRIRALAITGTQRYPLLPDVPTFSELGVAGLEPYGWYGILAPAGTPQPIVDKLSQAIVQIVKTPDMTQRLQALGLQVVGSTPGAFAQVMRDDGQAWAEAIRAGGIRME